MGHLDSVFEDLSHDALHARLFDVSGKNRRGWGGDHPPPRKQRRNIDIIIRGLTDDHVGHVRPVYDVYIVPDHLYSRARCACPVKLVT